MESSFQLPRADDVYEIETCGVGGNDLLAQAKMRKKRKLKLRGEIRLASSRE